MFQFILLAAVLLFWLLVFNLYVYGSAIKLWPRSRVQRPMMFDDDDCEQLTISGSFFWPVRGFVSVHVNIQWISDVRIEFSTSYNNVCRRKVNYYSTLRKSFLWHRRNTGLLSNCRISSRLSNIIFGICLFFSVFVSAKSWPSDKNVEYLLYFPSIKRY